jgi:hypothetical protein
MDWIKDLSRPRPQRDVLDLVLEEAHRLGVCGGMKGSLGRTLALALIARITCTLTPAASRTPVMSYLSHMMLRVQSVTSLF